MFGNTDKDVLYFDEAATRVFNIPELLELILLHLPWERSHDEIHTSRLIFLASSISKTWYHLLAASTPVRNRLYLPTVTDPAEAKVWLQKTAFPPAQPNPWTTLLLLHQRSWGTAYPFDNSYSADNIEPSKAKFWTYSLEVSRDQMNRFPDAGQWRDMLATYPPFNELYFTRAFYELGSGRTPSVTYVDYVPHKAKWDQQFVKYNENGITLGDIADAVRELFSVTTSNYIKWVRVESIHRPQPQHQEHPAADSEEVGQQKRNLSSIGRAILWGKPGSVDAG